MHRIYFFLATMFLVWFMGVESKAADALVVTGGIQIQLGNSEYSDDHANVDIQKLYNVDSAWTYGLSGGLYRMKDFYDNDDGIGPKYEGFDALYVCGRVGTIIRPAEFLYMSFITGPCYFEQAKGLISGNIQFNTEAGYGLRDPKTGSFVGLTYKHFSNGGMKSPNIGANFILLTMGISL